MARRPRSDLPDGVYHVTSRRGGDIFLDDHDRRLWIVLFDEVRARFEWSCVVYCQMTNQFHFVVEATRERLTRGMHRLNGRYAQRFNARHNELGHVFQGRFDARVVEGDDYLRTVTEYVLDNPVRAGLCATAADWPWSYAGAEATR
jgi:putative transposase